MILKIDNKLIEIKVANNFKDKLLGFMGKSGFTHGILFRCNGIHTFFMKEEIDVVLADKDYTVLYLYNNLKKNRIIMPKSNVYYTIELPSNTITNLCAGDVLNIKEKE